MLDVLLARLRQKHRTMRWPDGPAPALADRFRGRPELDPGITLDVAREAAASCPTAAILADKLGARVDLGRCLFCADCPLAATTPGMRFTPEFRLATSRREDLVTADGEIQLASALADQTRRIFGRSLKLRQVSAGGCNACELDTNVLNTLAFDLGRFGIQFVASPRHADGILVTGPVTEAMRLALEKTWAAIPPPKIVIAVGACAISGGPYLDHPEAHNGVGTFLPVDLYVPGCPPHPMTILDGLLRLLGRIER